MEPPAGESAAPRLVSTLLGHSHVAMALFCLGSLLRCSARPLRLLVHDDGSLTAADLALLAAGLGSPAVVPRREADQRMHELLAARPAARAFRAANPLAAKLLDATLLAPGDELAYCDADILFLRPFSRLFELAGGAGALFMTDPQNAYSVRFWHLLREPRLRLAAHVNSGIVVVRKSCLDLDLLEWFLARPEHQFAPVWLEQTCWALLGQAAGCHLLDPAAVAIPVPGRETSDSQRVALHFVSPVRALLHRYAGGPDLAAAAATAAAAAATAATAIASSAAAAPTPRAPVAVTSRPARRLTAAALAATELRRRLRRFTCWPGSAG
jgi:hypothetical protein